MRTLVLGLGNELAGDDAVGLVVARAVREELEGVADVVESSASGLALIDVLAGYERAVVVDAILTDRHPPGTIIELGLDELGKAVAPSTHQAGVPALAVVARRLGLRFPQTTRVLAIEVVDPYTLGAPLSDPVARAVGELARRVLERVRGWEEEDGCTTSPPSRRSSSV